MNKKISMNWGNKLLLAFIVFAALMGTMVYQSFQKPVNLVSSDYYQDELKFQQQIDGAGNANKLSTVTINQDLDSLHINLPVEMRGKKINGEAWFYCITNPENDKRFSLQLDEKGVQSFSKNKLAKGAFQLKLKWQSEDKNYYVEKEVMIN